MKVYISVDIEGITNVTNWDETELSHDNHAAASAQMCREAMAACKGAIAAGATKIYLKDAHDSARNFFGEDLPEEVTFIRGWALSPESMMAGIDETFDAAVMIGYHSGAGFEGNPLSHTMNTRNNELRINGKPIAEFDMNTFVAAYYGVPVVFLSGDVKLCEHAKELVPAIGTVGVKDGLGEATFNMSCTKACKLIEEGVKKALANPAACKIQSPDSFTMEINFKELADAYRASFYPGAEKLDSRTVRFTGKDIQEMMAARMFML